MDEFFFWSVLFLIFIGIPIGFFWFLYFIGKKLQSKRTGIILASSVGSLFLLVYVYLYFEDEFFTKSEARKILTNNKIELKEDFEIIDNETGGGIGDCYHEFHLKISEKDKLRLFTNFKKKSDSLKKMNKEYPESYENNYSVFKENQGLDKYDREFISVSKKQNELEYQLIHE